jgi:hypothetical protein
MAGSLTECPACRSALLVPPATRTITRCRSWAGKVGVWLATLLLWTCVGVAVAALYWVLYLVLYLTFEGKGIGKALRVEVEDALPILQGLMLMSGLVGGFVGVLYGLCLTFPDEPPPGQPTQRPEPVREEEWRTRKARDG